MNLDYLRTNQNLWNKKLAHHLNSEFYDLDGFLNGKTSLKELELEMLGDVNEKSILHLQCHFGQDSLSLARMGAKVTGVDLSDQAIAKAKELNQHLKLKANFICSDVYDLKNKLSEKFDIVFTTYGVIGWLPNIDKWADTISHFLNPGGILVFVEFHPVLWMFDDKVEEVTYTYHKTEPIIELEEHTYAAHNAEINMNSVTWNHSIGEVINALIKNGIEIKALSEYPYTFFPISPQFEAVGKGRYQVKKHGNKLPLLYSILGKKA